jgi:hypothetical protein
MSSVARLLVLVGLFSIGCGGSTSKDSTPGGGAGGAGAGSGAVGSTGGVSAGGMSTGGVSTGGVSTGGVSTGGVGAGGAGGVSTGGAGGGDLCCTSDFDCSAYTAEGYGFECVNSVCKQNPDPGLCWSDSDCQGIPGSCWGGSVCPCGADCFAADTLGKCVIPDQCCASDSDCASAPPGNAVCIAGNCSTKPPPGQCWTDADCPANTNCGGACICPCGSMCACGGQMGWCEGTKPD